MLYQHCRHCSTDYRVRTKGLRAAANGGEVPILQTLLRKLQKTAPICRIFTYTPPNCDRIRLFYSHLLKPKYEQILTPRITLIDFAARAPPQVPWAPRNSIIAFGPSYITSDPANGSHPFPPSHPELLNRPSI